MYYINKYNIKLSIIYVNVMYLCIYKYNTQQQTSHLIDYHHLRRHYSFFTPTKDTIP